MAYPLSSHTADRNVRLTDWGETIAPAVYRSAATYELPLPVTLLKVRDSWDFERFKVPLADGDKRTGHSRKGVEITLHGQFGVSGGGFLADEDAMFTELNALRAALDVSPSAGKFEFFLTHDTSTPKYRKFKSCSTEWFEFDVSHRHLFLYKAVIHADDPLIYTTAPGA